MRKIKLTLIFLFITFLFFISNISFAKYINVIDKIIGSAVIAEPIIICEASNTIKKEINKETDIPEYFFTIKNYIEDENLIKINEVDFMYNIDIVNLNENFPIQYELYDCDSGEKIQMVQNKSSFLYLTKNDKEEKKFKLKLNWENRNTELAEFDNIKIIINVIQRQV